MCKIAALAHKLINNWQFCKLSLVFNNNRYLHVLNSTNAYKQCSVRFYLQLFVVGLMRYLCYLCLFAHSRVQHHTLFCVFVLFFLDLCSQCYQFIWIVHCWLPLRYSHLVAYFNSSWDILQCNKLFRSVSMPSKFACDFNNYHVLFRKIFGIWQIWYPNIKSYFGIAIPH